MKLHWEANGRVWMDQACINACWSTITPNINVSSLFPHLVSHNLASSDGNDYHHLLNQPPAQAKQYLLLLVSSAGLYGPYLLYMCFLASCSGCLGHSYTAKELRKEGENYLKVVFSIRFFKLSLLHPSHTHTHSLSLSLSLSLIPTQLSRGGLYHHLKYLEILQHWKEMGKQQTRRMQ